jgi:hypothetical protein
MFGRTLRALTGALLISVVHAGCTMDKSEHPLGPSVAGPIPGVDISTPTPLEPSQGIRIPVASQPISLVLADAASSGVRPLHYAVEVATDVGFANKVYSREGIQPDGNGRTTVRLPDRLAPERSYYWRARAQDGANTGPYSGPAFFNVYTPIVLGKPILQEPVGNTTTSTQQPTFRIGNAPRSGPAGDVVYEIELSETDSFANKVGAWAVDERPGVTTLACPIQLTANRQYFWRVRAYDDTTVGPWSDIQAFRAPAPSAGGGGGGGGGGSSCAPNATMHVGGSSLDTTRAELIVRATGREFSCLLAVFPTDDLALVNAEQLLRRMIWHLKLAGFQANRQQNPSGLISNDKLTINIGGWRVWDVMTLGYAGVAGTVTFNEVPLPNPIPDTGIPD